MLLLFSFQLEIFGRRLYEMLLKQLFLFVLLVKSPEVQSTMSVSTQAPNLFFANVICMLVCLSARNCGENVVYFIILSIKEHVLCKNEHYFSTGNSKGFEDL